MVIQSINPATLENNGDVQETPKSEFKEIFERAREAQRKWRDIPICKRAKIVVRVNQQISNKIEEISELISREVGKPPLEAFISEVYGAMDSTFYYFSVVDHEIGQKKPIDLRFYGSLNKRSYITYKPAGVITVIGPYNYPFAIPFNQIVQSLMAGNAVVFKPSSDTVFVGQKIQELFNGVKDFPKDLLTTVYGSGSELGKPLIDLGDRVIFTGSTSTGKHIMRQAADTLTPVTLELGGKSAMVVLEDANLDRAALAAKWGCFTNSGQVCASVKRLYIQESVKDTFVDKLVTLTNKIKQGNPLEKHVDIGAMVNEHQMNLVLKMIDHAKTEGANILTGGKRKPGLKGYFVEPTILGDCTNNMDCVQKEIFGPVLTIIPFSDPEEAIKMVNDNKYGLTSSVWTENIELGERLARKIDTGTAMVNEVVYTFALAMTPWGGTKESGIGRSHANYGFEEVVAPLHVNIDTSQDTDPWWMPYDADFEESMENFKLVAKSLILRE